jgi:hypothetical protein
MKRVIGIIAVVAIISMALPVVVGAADDSVRIVNTSAIGDKTMIGPKGLVILSRLSIAQNPEIFPIVKDLVVTNEGGAMTITSSIAPEEKLDFVSLKYAEYPGGFDIAVVTSGGKVTRVDDKVVIDYAGRTLKTQRPISVGAGDVVLIFVRDTEEIQFGAGNDVIYHGGNDGGDDAKPGNSGGGGVVHGDSISPAK